MNNKPKEPTPRWCPKCEILVSSNPKIHNPCGTTLIGIPPIEFKLPLSIS